MRNIRHIILLLFIVVITFYWLVSDGRSEEAGVLNGAYEKPLLLQTKTIPDIPPIKKILIGDMYHWIGKTQEELIQSLGHPNREDLSAYQYVWWVYTDGTTYYAQFGVENGIIQTVYVTGEGFSMEPFEIGTSYDSINQELPFENEVTYSDGYASYTFRLTAEDLRRRPLVKVSDDLFIQFYFDTFKNELSSVRMMHANVLLRHQPYEVYYRGSLPPKPDLAEDEWRQVEFGMEQQIFDISNVIRHRFNKSPLLWEEEVREVAYLHSKDMNENNYFSHFSLNGDGLKERLAVNEIYYFSAGENIAAQYPDAPSAVEGWLNSVGHREALLADEYTHLGVGVYRFYYTQNFLAKPM